MPRKAPKKVMKKPAPVTPETTPGAVTPAAPLFLAVLEADAVECVEVAADEALAVVIPAAAEVAAAGVVAAALVAGTVAPAAAPLISAWTVLLKVPVMPLRVNLAE